LGRANFADVDPNPYEKTVEAGMRLVKDYLPRAYADGSDLDVRAHIMTLKKPAPF
jgi:alcohol dehydrogenase class IV